jgi:hypothetical protein
VYGIGLGISGAVFNWQYAREQGFWRWLLLGEVVSTLKATIWPYYLLAGGVGEDQQPAHPRITADSGREEKLGAQEIHTNSHSRIDLSHLAMENNENVRDLLDRWAEEWMRAHSSEPTICSSKPGEVCIDQFRVESATDRSALIRHRRILSDYDPEQLVAYVNIFGDGENERQELCTPGTLDLFRRYGLEIETRYYSKQLKPLYSHTVNLQDCQDRSLRDPEGEQTP